MKVRANKVAFRGKVERRDEAADLLLSSGDFAIVDRGKARLIVLRCPCGCGDDLLVNVDKRVGPAWRYYRNQYGMTLYPSYWRDSACGSHFIIWNDNVYWCSGWETDQSEEWAVPVEVENAVLANLPGDTFVKFYYLAENLDMIPWEVLQACHQLVFKGLAVGNWRERDEFRRAVATD